MTRGRALAAFVALAALVPSPALAAPPATTTPAAPTTVGPPIIPPPSGSAAGPSQTINYGPAPSLPISSGADPACRTRGINADATRACSGSGSPLAPFPSGNYGLDVHIDTGVLSPSDDLASFFQGVAGWIFGIVTSLLGTVFGWLGATFGFDLFSADHSGRIPGTLHAVSGAFSNPLLPTALAIGGCVALWYWARHDQGKALGHLLAMCASMIAVLVLIADPIGILGGVDRGVNSLSGDVLAVFATGHSGGTGAFASAEPGLWQQGVERPWCALEFGQDTTWCMSPLSEPAWRSDAAAHVSKADENSTPQVQADERRRLGLARTNGEMWLAFPPNDDARNGKNDPWTLYHHLLASRPDLAAIRGSGGVGTRWATLAVILVGIIPFLLVMLYVALHLLAAAVAFVFLLLLTPVSVLLSAFGEQGRAAAAKNVGGLMVALLLKVGYAAALGALVLTSSILAQLADALGGAWMLGWGVWALLWVMAWVHRGKLLSAFTLGMHQQAHSMVYRRNFRREGRTRDRVRGVAGTIGNLGPMTPRWRAPGERSSGNPGASARRPVPVYSWQDRSPRPVIEGRAETLPPPRSEPPALPSGKVA